MNAIQPEFLADKIESPICLVAENASLGATVERLLHAEAPDFSGPNSSSIIEISPAHHTDAAGELEQRNDGLLSLLESFNTHRRMLFGIASRILGSMSDADDMLQELWLRWQRQDSGRIQSAKAWLGSTMTRLCIDQLRSARRQREDSYGVCMPEPLMADVEPAADSSVDQEYVLATACAKMLETLRPVERAVFMLHEVLGYDYSDAAAIVGKDVANCRQILHRAKVQLRADSKARPVSDCASRLAKQIPIAADTGELTVLLALLQGDQIPCAPELESHGSA